MATGLRLRSSARSLVRICFSRRRKRTHLQRRYHHTNDVPHSQLHTPADILLAPFVPVEDSALTSPRTGEDASSLAIQLWVRLEEGWKGLGEDVLDERVSVGMGEEVRAQLCDELATIAKAGRKTYGRR